MVPLLAKITMFRDSDKTQEVASGEFQITGLFASNKMLEKQIEETLVKVRGPAILFPFLRACVSNILINAGFAQIQMPLVNVGEMAKDAKTKVIHQKLN